MNFVCVLLLIGWSAAKRCDKYVTGQVWIHKSAATDEYSSSGYSGCKKGCFDNATFKDDGSRKCEKCNIIKDEELCLNNTETCLWKGGKCVSQSCPQMAKEPNILHHLYKICVEGSPKEQKFNNDYWNDFKANRNSSLRDTTLHNFGWVCEDRIVSTLCRDLPETKKNVCYFRTQEQYYSSTSTKNVKDTCLTENYYTLQSSGITLPIGGANQAYIDLNNQTKFKLTYGFSSAAEVCDNEISYRLKMCDNTYDDDIRDCNSNYRNPRTGKSLNHIETKAARAKCHNVYGCMYSKDNERCSVWAVWAFVLVLVLCIVVIVVVIIVLVIVLIPKVKKVESA